MESSAKQRTRPRPALGLLALYLVAAVAYALASRSVKVPILYPDEFHYGHIAQSLAEGEGATWNGAHEGVRSLLYLFAITPSWLVASGTDAYLVAKILGAAMCSLVAVPVWLLARELSDGRRALVPATLALAGTWMATTGQILTENLALPLSAAALAAMVMTLRRPASRWWVAAVGLSALAVFARLQVGVLFPIFLAALLLDGLRHARAGARARLQAHRLALAVTGALSIAGLVLLLVSGGSALGIYSSVGDFRPGVVRLLEASSQQALALVVITGVVPAVLALTLAVRRVSWRDDDTGPLLAVMLCAAAGFVLESGFFVAGFHASWDIERYVYYAVPLVLVAMVLAPGRVTWRAGLPVTAAVAVALLATQDVHTPIEQRAVFGATKRLGGLMDSFGQPGFGLALAAALLATAALAILARPERDRALAGAGALVLVVLVVISQAAWHEQARYSDAQRAQQPADLEWVDHAARGPVGILNTAADNRAFQVTWFFNEKIEADEDVTGPIAPLGPRCVLKLSADGRLSGDGCTPPATFLIENTVARPTLYGETVLADEGYKGRLVRVSGTPRLRSIIDDPCLDRGEPYRGADLPVRACRGVVGTDLWLDEPGVLTFTFRGGSAQHYGRLNGKVISFPPGKERSAHADVAAGHTSTGMQLDWPTTAGAPVLRSVTLKLESGETVRLG